jgi:hypothetical protein
VAVGLVALVLAAVAGCGNGMGREGWATLYNGRDLAGWGPQQPQPASTWQAAGAVQLDPADARKFVIEPGQGILVNGPGGRTNDIYTQQEFGDCELHIEFCVPKDSNSGVYLMGNYEIQVLDSYGKEPVTFSDCGGIYARWINEQNVEGHTPRVNASKAPGSWQAFDIVFRAPRFDAGGKKVENARLISVKLNGKLIHENVSLNAPTRGSMFDQERARGPVRLQGDHGPVAYRNIRIRPLDAR